MTLGELERLGFVEHHKCGICGSPVGYQIDSYFAAAIFNRKCDCPGAGSFRYVGNEELAKIPSANETPNE